jgi:hypothetical protein
MATEIWLAITSVLTSIVAVMFMMGYKDISRRILKLEKQDAKLYAAILTLLIAKTTDTDAVANALHGLLTNGVEHQV